MEQPQGFLWFLAFPLAVDGSGAAGVAIINLLCHAGVDHIIALGRSAFPGLYRAMRAGR